MKKLNYLLFVALIFVLLPSCRGDSNLAGDSNSEEHIQMYATSVAVATRQASNAAERIELRWFVGLGDSLTDKQKEKLSGLADQFNASQHEVWLQLIVVDEADALSYLRDMAREGSLPDLIGPIGLDSANYFYGEWLDLRPYLSQNTVSQFSVQSLSYYEQNGRLEGIPLNIYPSFIYFNRSLFDQANLPYPPQSIDKPYADGETWDFEKLTQLASQLTLDEDGNQSGSSQFNPERIVQFGYINQWTETTREGVSPFGIDSLINAEGQVEMNPTMRDGIHWTYEAIWRHHFYPSQDEQFSDLFANANTFRSGHVAMAFAPLWFTCCVNDSGFEWDIAVVPSYQGQTTAKVHSDGFRVFKESAHSETAVEVLHWLLDTGYEDLLLAYGGIPAQPEWVPFMMNQLETHYPIVNWWVALDSLAYADVPHHQEYLPNYQQAQMVDQLFWNLLETTPGLNLEREIDALESHLQLIVDEELD